MARDYTRPDVSPEFASELLGSRRIVMQPTREDVHVAVKAAEKRCRKNRLSAKQIDQLWDRFAEGNEPTDWIGEWSCPPAFNYGIDGTVVQLVRITDELVGLVCERVKVLPGERSGPFIYPRAFEGFDEEPSHWFNEVMTCFWLFLTDEEIEAMQRRTLIQAMVAAADLDTRARRSQAIRRAAVARREREEEANRAAQQREEQREELVQQRKEERRQQLNSLLGGEPPEFTSELRHGLTTIMEAVANEGGDSVSWRDIKRRWPALAARFKPALLKLTGGESVPIEGMRNHSIDESGYTLAFWLWDGSQRIFEAPQIAVLVQNRDLLAKFAAPGGVNFATTTLSNVERLEDVALRDRWYHPKTRDTIGWLRVHLDSENQLCFVDEVQSDAIEATRSRESGLAQQFQQMCADWHIHGFASIYRWALRIGYRPAIHSRASAATVEGMTPSDRKWNTYYRPLIKRFGLATEQVEGYPAEIWVGQ